MQWLARWRASSCGTALERIWRRTLGDQIFNRAAELAFWFLVGFFPMLLSVASIASMMSFGHNSRGTLVAYIGEVMPSTASSMVGNILAQTTGGGRAWLSLLFALWTSSSATVGIMDTLNIIYGVKEGRPWWKARLVAMALAAATGVLLTAALVIVVYGPVLLSVLLPSSATLHLWRLAQWPAAMALLMTALFCVYRFAPNRHRQKWRHLVPGSVVAALIWVAVSLLFKFYVRHFSDFGVLYGSLGTLVVLMFWFYLSGVAILIGGEVNSTLERAARE
jgi:membrane protein